ncbi:DUF58 domain-containing protein [Halorubellus litoreus]|uniref:DUF58 domain-containing protein n=1 Tax=Halorubellus litoreus TaxID=755308 RepID=A0ABD5V8K8_9EURY
MSATTTTTDGPETDDGAASTETAAEDTPSADADVEFDGETVGARIIKHHETATNHWEGVAAVTTLLGGTGIIFRSPALLLAAVVGIAFVAYAKVAEPVRVELAVDRELSDADPDLGDEVDVTVHVKNTGESTLPDLRLVDGVPESLEVVDGTARAATFLRPGERTSFSYTVAAKRGTHEFRTLSVYARGFTGSIETELDLAAATEMVATPSLEATAEVPLRQQTSRYAGRVDTNTGGEGLEFYQTREYRRGDSLSRIDWKRHARTGELTTVEFREEKAATVVCVLDLRQGAYVHAEGDNFHAADHGIDAAGQVFATLLETGDRVGIGALSASGVWLAPGLGNEHRIRAEELFARHPALSPERPDDYFSLGIGLRNLRKRLPNDAQVIMFSPLADDEAAKAARLLHAHGHAVTIISPDPTDGATLGHRVARVERLARISALREVGVRAVDWNVDDTLATTLARARRRWSA